MKEYKLVINCRKYFLIRNYLVELNQSGYFNNDKIMKSFYKSFVIEASIKLSKQQNKFDEDIEVVFKLRENHNILSTVGLFCREHSMDQRVNNPALANALLDLNGKKNTEYLVSLNLDCKAAIACHNYNDGASNLQWYLPGMGELGFLMVRLKEINNTLKKLNKTQITGSLSFWSSTAGYDNAFYLNTTNGYVYKSSHKRTYYVRPFAILE
jgi:hypothetical protein